MVDRYQCGKSGSKNSILKVPEGINVKCTANSWIVSPSTKCEVTCSTGSPNYDSIQCKAKGWRPTNKLQCEGVAPGVIVGILVAGLIGVILLAIVYAKYKQYQKDKNGNTSKRPLGKQQSSTRSRKNLVGDLNKAPDRNSSLSSGYVGSEGARSTMGTRSNLSSKSDSQGSYPPSYSGLEASRSVPSMSRQPGSFGAPPYQKQPHQQMSSGRDSGYNGYQYDGAYPSAFSDPNAFYQGQQLGYGFPNHSPAVGYGATSQAPSHLPMNSDYSKPYHVST